MQLRDQQIAARESDNERKFFGWTKRGKRIAYRFFGLKRIKFYGKTRRIKNMCLL